jgi:hypothetical protein
MQKSQVTYAPFDSGQSLIARLSGDYHKRFFEGLAQ